MSETYDIEVAGAGARLRLLLRRSALDIVEIGKELIFVREKLPYGEFLPWLASEFQMSERTAYRFINAAKNLPKSATVANLPPSVVYELTSPATPEEAVEQKLAVGEKVTKETVKRVKQALRKVEQTPTIPESKEKDTRGTPLFKSPSKEAQVTRLMEAWDAASPEARREFVRIQNAEICRILNAPHLQNTERPAGTPTPPATPAPGEEGGLAAEPSSPPRPEWDDGEWPYFQTPKHLLRDPNNPMK